MLILIERIFVNHLKTFYYNYFPHFSQNWWSILIKIWLNWNVNSVLNANLFLSKKKDIKELILFYVVLFLKTCYFYIHYILFTIDRYFRIITNFVLVDHLNVPFRLIKSIYWYMFTFEFFLTKYFYITFQFIKIW